MGDSISERSTEVLQVSGAERTDASVLIQSAEGNSGTIQTTGMVEIKSRNAVLENPRWVEWTERLNLLAEWMEHNEEKTNYYKPLQ